jgi:hypothetical protein
MAIFATLFTTLHKAEVPFLVIGGHAVVLLGHFRNTFDLDILLPESHLEIARDAFSLLGYHQYFKTTAFLQLTAPPGLPPLDLMVVDQTTFERLDRFAEERIFDGERIKIPSAVHLVALKLHATRDVTRQSSEIDWEDIVGVLRAAKQNIDDPEFRAIVERYGGPEAIHEIKRRLAGF